MDNVHIRSYLCQIVQLTSFIERSQLMVNSAMSVRKKISLEKEEIMSLTPTAYEHMMSTFAHAHLLFPFFFYIHL